MFMIKSAYPLPSGHHCAVSTGTGSEDAAFNVVLSMGTFGCIGVMGYNRDFYPSTTFVADGAWHHVKVIWDQVTLKIYVDGIVKASTAAMSDGGTAFLTSGNTNYLGKNNHLSATNIFLAGQMKEIHFFDFVVGDCAPGFTSMNSGLTCTACESGKHKTVGGNFACATCASNNTGCGGASAGICNAGYGSTNGGATCTACAAGTYKAAAGNEACAESLYSHEEVLTFDGTAGTVVDISTQLSSVQGNNPRTIMLTLKTSTIMRQQAISTGTPATGQTFNIRLGTANNGCVGVMGYNRDFYPSTTSVADGAWHRIKVTWDTETLKIYIDGIMEASTTTMEGATSFATSGNNNFIGYVHFESYAVIVRSIYVCITGIV